MFRKTVMSVALLGAVALATVALVTAPRTARADGNPSASGAGAYLLGDSEVKFSFNAVLMEDGSAIGHAVFKYGTSPDARLEIDIDGLSFNGYWNLTGIAKRGFGGIEAGSRVLFIVGDDSDGFDADYVVDPPVLALLLASGWSVDEAIAATAGPVVRGNIRTHWE